MLENTNHFQMENECVSYKTTRPHVKTADPDFPHRPTASHAGCVQSGSHRPPAGAMAQSQLRPRNLTGRSRVCVLSKCLWPSAGNAIPDRSNRADHWQPVAGSGPPTGHSWGRDTLGKTRLVSILVIFFLLRGPPPLLGIGR